MTLTEYIIARQLGLPTAKLVRPVRRPRGACAACGRQLAYDQSGTVVHTLTGRFECSSATVGRIER